MKIAIYNLQICTYLTFSGLFFLLLLHVWELVPTDLSTWKNVQFSIIHFPVIWRERNFPRKESPALPIRKSATCDQRASTFFLGAGVNPAPLVKSLQGLYFWEIKRQPVWGPFSCPTEPFVTGNTPPLGIFQYSSNPGHAQCTWPCSKTGAALPQAESEEIQKITSFSRPFYSGAWKGSCVCRPKHTLFLPFFFSLQ